MSKSRKRKQKRTASIILIAVALVLVVGVVAYVLVSKSGDKTELTTANTTNTEQTTTAEDDGLSIDETASDLSDAGLTFDELAKYNYSFSSGAGGWSDDFNIEKDGYFHGNYHDSEMGDIGDEYPDGTFYECQYEGHFASIERVDEYTCKMTMMDLTNLTEKGEYIEDGIRYISSEPYALTNAKEVEIYLPGKPVSEIPEEVQTWLGLDFVDEKPEKLDNIALVNVNEQYGIVGYERMSAKEEADSLCGSAKSSYDFYQDKLESAMTTVEMVDATSAQAKAVDGCLNSLWTLVKYNTDNDTYNKALEEQRQWLKDRDAKLDALPKEGSLAPVDYNSLMATLTLERCEELIKYIN